VSDTRAADYIRKYGGHSWELDALEPSILEALIEREVADLIDEEIWSETEAEQSERREVLKSLHDRFEDIKDFLGRA
jgi:transcription initiation factor IIE alpha subunit